MCHTNLCTVFTHSQFPTHVRDLADNKIELIHVAILCGACTVYTYTGTCLYRSPVVQRLADIPHNTCE